jgi:CrcB protein
MGAAMEPTDSCKRKARYTTFLFSLLVQFVRLFKGEGRAFHGNSGAVSWWVRVVLVAATGALGAVTRYLVGLLVLYVSRDLGFGFVATLIVNAVGSFLFGYFAALPTDVTWMTPALRLAMLTGFLGGLTTFSAFAGDTLQLFQVRGAVWAVSYVIAQNTLGISLAAWGAHWGKLG